MSQPTGAARTPEQFVKTLAELGTVLCIKLYRLGLETTKLRVPVLPCLDHEAMLHEGISPHAAAYLQDREGDLHEVVFLPDTGRLDVDTVSTLGERSSRSHERLVADLKSRFPECTVHEIGPSWLRGDLRVAKACRAQVTLRDVLLGEDLDTTKAAVDRLQTISALMEKHSRVASWGARTVMTPLLALAGFVTYQALASLDLAADYQWVSSLRYLVVGVIGAYFLYYGLKAVQLTEMANRVWKRSAEYGLILSERKRLAQRLKG